MSKSKLPWIRVAAPLAVLTIVAGVAGWQLSQRGGTGAGGPAGTTLKQPDSCTGRAFAEIGGPFELVNQDGQTVTQASFAGRPMLIYFGFTYCPDVCPFSLQTMAQALEAAGPAASRVQPVLISLDPERDTPEAMKQYVASAGFPKGLIGLTGTPEQTAAAARAYKVSWRRNDTPASAAQYLIDHSSILYLVGSDGKLRTFFTDAEGPDSIGQCLAELSTAGL
jgi:protein SCO1/2